MTIRFLAVILLTRGNSRLLVHNNNNSGGGNGVSAQTTEASNPTTCSLCPNDDNAVLGNPEKFIPLLGIPGSPFPTCQDAANYAPLVASDEICTLLQAQAAFCGCPNAITTNPCSFCPNGEPPANGDLVITGLGGGGGGAGRGGGLTCNELDEYVSFLDDDQCETEPVVNIQRYGFMCGCLSTTPECAMCPDGSITMEFPDRVVPFFNLAGGISDPTCMEVAEAAAVAPPNSIQCELVQAQGGYCGCSNVEPTRACHFCPLGNMPTNERLQFVTPTNDTCEDLYHYVEYLSEDECNSARFISLQGLGYVCGCPGVGPACTLCADESPPPDPSQPLLPGSSTTCGDMDTIVASYTPEVCADNDRNTRVAASRCGCPGAKEDFPVCNVQQNPHLCTHALLDSTDEDCECSAFCDGEFVQCHDFPGGLLSVQLCSGISVSGCNRANALDDKVAGGGGSAGSSATARWVSRDSVVVPTMILSLGLSWL